MNPILHRIALGPKSVGEALSLVDIVADPARGGTGARLAVVVEELVINLVDHAAGGTAIWLGMEPIGAGIRLVLIDDAAPFDPRITPAGDLPNEDRGGGAGLAIIRAWSRILDYRRIADRNRLEIVVLPDPDNP